MLMKKILLLKDDKHSCIIEKNNVKVYKNAPIDFQFPCAVGTESARRDPMNPMNEFRYQSKLKIDGNFFPKGSLYFSNYHRCKIR